ncbi:hypothetical protein I204_07725 [Kwoniella mangroviensis CBS 8886]|nr:hypothetical protein I204_07725 [Kwoniella mangroviensis CBS 8886]
MFDSATQPQSSSIFTIITSIPASVASAISSYLPGGSTAKSEPPMPEIYNKWGQELIERNTAYRSVFSAFKPIKVTVESGSTPSQELKSNYDEACGTLLHVIKTQNPCNWIAPGGREDTWGRWASGETNAPNEQVRQEAFSQYDEKGEIQTEWNAMTSWASAKNAEWDELTSVL